MLALAICSAIAGAAPALAYDEASLDASLTRQMSRATPSSGLYVEDLDSGRELFARRAGSARLPASVEKLYTTATTLLRLGPNATLPTSAVSSGDIGSDGVLHGDLVLVGDGDPFFGTAAAARLARAVRAVGVKRIDGAVVGDESEFDGLRSGCCKAYDSDLGGVLSALAWDRGILGGRAQVRAAPFAAARFAALLEAAGVRSSGKPRAGAAPLGAATLAAVPSADVRDMIRRTNVPSDNFAAEMLLKEVGRRASGKAGSTANGIAAVQRFLTKHSIPYGTSKDGSGLARADRRTASGLVRLLQYTSRVAVAPAFGAALPVACSSGTLLHRMCGTAAAGRLYAKTGTLHGVRALSGYTTTRSGKLVVFSFLLNGISDMTAAGNALDAAAVVLASAA